MRGAWEEFEVVAGRGWREEWEEEVMLFYFNQKHVLKKEKKSGLEFSSVCSPTEPHCTYFLSKVWVHWY